IQTEAIEAYDLLVLTCAELGQTHADEGALREAAEVAEASRARNLMELLADETLQPVNAPEVVVEEYRRLRRRLRQAERLLRDQENAPRTAPNSAALTGSRPVRGPAGRTPGTSRTVQPLPRQTDPPDLVRQEVERLQGEHQRLLQRIQADYDREFNPDQ